VIAPAGVELGKCAPRGYAAFSFHITTTKKATAAERRITTPSTTSQRGNHGTEVREPHFLQKSTGERRCAAGKSIFSPQC